MIKLKEHRFSITFYLILIFFFFNIKPCLAGWPPPEWAKYPEIRNILVEKQSIWFFTHIDDGKCLIFEYNKNKKTWRNHGEKSYFKKDLYSLRFPKAYYARVFDYETHSLKINDQFTLIEKEDEGKTDLISRPIRHILKDERTGKKYEFVPQIDEKTHLKLSKIVEYGVCLERGNKKLPIARSFSAIIVYRNKIWCGLSGGFSEGWGGLGGLAVFDMEKKKWSSIFHELLAESSIEYIYAETDHLWMGTAHWGESGIGSINGLVRYDFTENTWEIFTPKNSPISGDLVYAIEKDKDTLWFATNYGISSYQPKRDYWESWLWHEYVDKDGKIKIELIKKPEKNIS